MATRKHPIVEYFSNIWTGLVTTAKGMQLTFRYLFKKPVTMQYPEVKPVIPESHRGLHRYIEEKCFLCNACVAVCPVDCIAIKSLGRGKDRLILEYNVDYSKCLFCNLCCEACNSDCLFLGPEYDLSAAERAGCVLHFARTKSPQEIEAFKVLWAQKEAERKAKAEAALKAKEAKDAAAKAALGAGAAPQKPTGEGEKK